MCVAKHGFKNNQMAILKRIIVLLIICFASGKRADNPCAARKIANESVVCVCNTTYCDTITREIPARGTYVTYTSSKGGLRFHKTIKNLQICNRSKRHSNITLELDPHTKYQTIEGFGGAVTDSAAINWKSLSDTLQKTLIDSYFSDTGLQYNMIRVPIGGSDFSTHAWAYNELPVNDTKLTNYTLAIEDCHFKIPMIKASLQASKVPVHIVATTWSPPPWMKTNNAYKGISRLKTEYYQTYADYHYKFLEKYAEKGVPIWAITTTNEPANGVIMADTINCLGWTSSTMGRWIVNNLGPTIRNSTYKDVKILAVDDQRALIPYWFNEMIRESPKALDYIDGVAVHYYMDDFTPASILTECMQGYPGKMLLATEACEGSLPWEKDKVEIGAWYRAAHYINDIITDLNHNVVGWIDWNLCLDAKGGPNWVKNNVDAPIIVYPERDEFAKQPMFYAMGHFSKFIPRGSRRIKITETNSWLAYSVESVAFLTPNNNVVVIVHNSGDAKTVIIKLGNKQASVLTEPKSVTTVEFPCLNSNVLSGTLSLNVNLNR